jgi:hypothetical protein
MGVNHMASTEEILRVTVATLMYATGERQGDLAAGLGITQGQISRKQSADSPTASSSWSLDDVDRLSSHYGIPVLDLLAGPSHALGKLPKERRAECVGGTQLVVAV